MSTSHHYALPSGHLLHNVYRIQRVLGAGAFGITYLAAHIHLGSSSVIKEYLPEFAVRRDGLVTPPYADKAEIFNWGLANFFDEAKILHGLRHDNIVQVSDLFEENGTAYFVMPYMGSHTLLDWMHSHTTPSVADLTAIFIPLLEGLQYIHERNLLHRDIKPANILLTPENKPVLIDFGSARSTLNQQKPMTKLYTPNFAPIEQLGQHTGTFTPALDIYSLSGCLYQIITGNLPEDAYERSQNDTQIKLAQSQSYRALYPVHWLEAIDKGLRVDAAARFQTANEMKQALLQSENHATNTFQQPKTQFTSAQDMPRTVKINHASNAPAQQKQAARIVPQAQKSPKKSSGSLKSFFRTIKNAFLLTILGGLVWVGLPLAKRFVPSANKEPPVDKPYHGTIDLTLNKQNVIYTGWIKNGIAEDNTGTATLQFADGTQCTVGMSNNQRSGTGKCTYPKGSEYDGAWRNDLKHGYGKYTLPKSSPILRYEGGFVNGKLSGKGIMTYKNKAVFAGEFANDDIKQNGKGEITGMFGMSVRCEGTFTKTRATCQFKQGKSIIQYEGSHKNGLWDGDGEVVMIDNGNETSRYRAKFRNGDIVGDPINAKKKEEKAKTLEPKTDNKTNNDDDEKTNTVEERKPQTLPPKSSKNAPKDSVENLF